jgi:predicted Zn-dependent protease
MLVESKPVQNYVAQLGAKLSAELASPALVYTFSVVETDQTNSLSEPLVLPGGYIFVPLSLLLAARDEGEFAGMLAQAMARHPLRIHAYAGTITTTLIGGWAGDSSCSLPVQRISGSKWSFVPTQPLP